MTSSLVTSHAQPKLCLSFSPSTGLSPVSPRRVSALAHAAVRKFGGASNRRRRSGSGPSSMQVLRSRGRQAAALTRKNGSGRAGTLRVQSGAGCPQRLARSSTTPAAIARSTESTSRGLSRVCSWTPVRRASTTHWRAARVSWPRSARTNSMRSMSFLPKVIKRVLSLQLSTGDKVWTQLHPHRLSRPGRCSRSNRASSMSTSSRQAESFMARSCWGASVRARSPGFSRTTAPGAKPWTNLFAASFSQSAGSPWLAATLAAAALNG
jgi:hypothetical protein